MAGVQEYNERMKNERNMAGVQEYNDYQIIRLSK